MRNANVEEKDGEYFLKLIFVRSGICKNCSIPLIKHEPKKPKSKIEKNLDKIENKLNDLAKKFEQLKTEKEESIKNKVKEIFNKDIKKVLFQEIEKFVESKANYGNKEIVKRFKAHSKISERINQSESNYDASNEDFKLIKKIIKNDLIINILKNKEDILFFNQSKFETITFDELINLKNKIYIKEENKSEIYRNKIEESKSEILMIFRKIVINLEIINKYIKELRERGSNLPIQINIRAKLNDIKYFLEQKEVKFTDIKNFLINIKNNYLIQLDRIYNDSEYIRFLFGKHLHNMKNHLENDYNVDSILRYILNNTEHNKKIKNGDKTSIYKLDFFNNYEFYNQNSLERFQSILILCSKKIIHH